MADPATALAAIGTATTVGASAVGIGASAASGALGAEGATQAGQATLNQNLYQYGIAQLNSQIATQNADLAINTGEQQEVSYGIQSAAQQSSIKTAQASSGFDVNSGSNLAVQAGQKKLAGLDQVQIRSNAAQSAYNYDIQSLQDQKQAGLYMLAGNNAVQAASINAESSIVGAAGSVASKWMQASQSGVFSGIGSSISSAAGSAATAAGFDPFAGY